MKSYQQVNEKVELCISPWLEDEIRQLFDTEMNNGYREVLEDGRIYFVFQISPEKSSLLHNLSVQAQYYGHSVSDN
jgi:hypothetical protein